MNQERPVASPKRILLLGATGTIGAATAQALVARGHEVVCIIRPRIQKRDTQASNKANPPLLTGTSLVTGDVSDLDALEASAFTGAPYDAVISCLASRTGTQKDAQLIDYQANFNALTLARRSGVPHMILLSAICVQRPNLAFQRVKLDFEAALKASGLVWSIVRPTAFFKSLSGQVDRVKAGRPYLIFGDGTLTACKPISDRDLAMYIAGCLEDKTRHNRILPIGGPGPAITPKAQGEYLFSLLDQPPRFQSVSPKLLLKISSVLSLLARLYPPLAAKAEYARIGHYYATQSMLALDPETQTYRAELTPETGQDTLFEHYRDLMEETGASNKGAS